MGTPTLRPEFRISAFDVVVLVAGIGSAVIVGSELWWMGAIVGFVVLHFFLFCNVFRISRRSELLWAAGFTALTGSTIYTGIPGWVATGVCAIALSSFLVWRETKKTDDHGG